MKKIISTGALAMAAVFGASAALAPAASAGAKPTVYYSMVWQPHLRPSLIAFGAGGSFFIKNIDWKYLSVDGTKVQWWGHGSAEGFGTMMIDNCKPNCAMGHYHKYPITLVKLYRVRYHSGNPYFTRMDVFFGAGWNHGNIKTYKLGKWGPG